MFLLDMTQLMFKQHRLLICAGSLSALAYMYLAISSQQYAQSNLIELWAVSGLCALLSLIVWRHYHNEKQTIPVQLILLFAVSFRLIGISGFPILEDDFYRYLWDGRMTIETGSPYGIAPAAFFSDNSISESFESILGLINYPDIPTIYGPVNQWVFALGYIIAPGQVWPLQLLFSLADLGIIILLLRLAAPQFVLLYAWSPLLIKEFAFTAHPDILGAFFLLAAFYIYARQSWFWLAVLLALAAGVKIFALILVPLLLRFHWRAWLVFITSAIIIAQPFGLKAAWVPAGLSAMASDWLFNAPLYSLLSLWLPISTIKALLLALFALTAATYFFYIVHKKQILPIRADRLFGLFFLCIPVLNPWYLAWLLPFAAIYPSRWAWAASFCLLLSYASGINLSGSNLALYQQPIWAVTVQFSVISAALLVDILKDISTRPTSH